MSPKQFFKRWGEGIQKITPIQLTFQQLIGQVIVLVGIIIGLVISFRYKQWWLFIILCGSLLVAGSTFIGSLQKYKVLKQFMAVPVQETKKKEVNYV